MKFTNDSNPHDKAKTKYNTHLHIPFQSLNTRHHTIITIHTSSHQPHDDHPKYQSGIQTSKSRQKSPETIKEPKERHHTKISFVKTSVSQSKYTANGSKKNTVQENTMCRTTPVIHQQLPKQHYHTLQVSSKPKPERTAPDICTPLLTLPS